MQLVSKASCSACLSGFRCFVYFLFVIWELSGQLFANKANRIWRLSNVSKRHSKQKTLLHVNRKRAKIPESELAFLRKFGTLGNLLPNNSCLLIFVNYENHTIFSPKNSASNKYLWLWILSFTSSEFLIKYKLYMFQLTDDYFLWKEDVLLCVCSCGRSLGH